jgi:hypothetical protein
MNNKRIAFIFLHMLIFLPLLLLFAPTFISAPSTVLAFIGLMLYILSGWYFYSIAIPMYRRFN